MKLFTIALMGMVLLLAVAAADLPARVGAASLLLGAAYGVGALVENLSAYFQGIERMHIWTQAASWYGAVTGGIGILAVIATHDLLAFCAAPLLGQLAALAWLLTRAPAAVRRPPRPQGEHIGRLLRQLAPFAVAFIATTLYYRGDVLLLAHLRSQAEVGTYMAARRFLDIAQALAVVAAGAALPRLSRRRDARDAGTRTGLDLYLLVCVPAAVLLFLLRDPLVLVLYGRDYAASVPVLALLAPALAPLAINTFCLAALFAADAAATAARLWTGAAILNLSLNALLIPRLGPAGAATAALVSELSLAAAFLAVQAKRGVTPSLAAARAAGGAGALGLIAALARPALGLAAAVLYLACVAGLYRLIGCFPARGRRRFGARAPEAA